jgi:hypothetical protein
MAYFGRNDKKNEGKHYELRTTALPAVGFAISVGVK